MTDILDSRDMEVLRWLYDNGGAQPEVVAGALDMPVEETQRRIAGLTERGLVEAGESSGPLPSFSTEEGTELVRRWIDYACEREREGDTAPKDAAALAEWLRDRGQLPDGMPAVAASFLIQQVIYEQAAAWIERNNERRLSG